MAFKMKSFSGFKNYFSPTSKYGKRHDRLRAKGHAIREEAMDVYDAGNTNKASRLEKKAARKLKRAQKIRNRQDN